MIYNWSCKEERKEIVVHTYSKSISICLTHLSKFSKLIGKCVDLPPDNLCQLNADIFSGRQIIIQLNADIFSGHQIIYVSLMLTDFLEPLTNLFLLQAQHQHNKCANAEPKTIRNNFWFMQQQILLLKKRLVSRFQIKSVYWRSQKYQRSQHLYLMRWKLALRTIDTTLGIKITSCCF